MPKSLWCCFSRFLRVCQPLHACIRMRVIAFTICFVRVLPTCHNVNNIPYLTSLLFFLGFCFVLFWFVLFCLRLFPTTAASSDATFFFGDLNYRIDLPRDECVQHITGFAEHTAAGRQQQHLDHLVRNDQLSVERRRGTILQGFAEPELRFCPTYKFDPLSDLWDTSEKRRTPSWTDRCLYQCSGDGGSGAAVSSGGDGIGCTPLHYGSIGGLKISDHRAVSAMFKLTLPPQQRCSNGSAAAWAEFESRRQKCVTIVAFPIPPEVTLQDLAVAFAPGRRKATGAAGAEAAREEGLDASEATASVVLLGIENSTGWISYAGPSAGDAASDAVALSGSIALGDYECMLTVIQCNSGQPVAPPRKARKKGKGGPPRPAAPAAQPPPRPQVKARSPPTRTPQPPPPRPAAPPPPPTTQPRSSAAPARKAAPPPQTTAANAGVKGPWQSGSGTFGATRRCCSLACSDPAAETAPAVYRHARQTKPTAPCVWRWRWRSSWWWCCCNRHYQWFGVGWRRMLQQQ